MNQNNVSILVVDDDQGVRRNLEKVLQREGYLVTTAIDGRSAAENLRKAAVHLAIVDLRMPDLEGKFSDKAGIELLRWIREYYPETFVIILTGVGTIRTAMEAINLGASSYLEKDRLSPTDLRAKVRSAIKMSDVIS